MISKGPGEVDVPNVVGSTRSEARSILSRAGFGVQVRTRVTEDEADDDVVLEQRPDARQQAPQGRERGDLRRASSWPRLVAAAGGEPHAMRVALLAGGRSSEHDVSLSSGAGVAEGLREAGHEVVEVLLERDGRWTLDGEPLALEPAGGLLGADVVFPVLHGPFGEDGTIQGLLEILDVPYVGAGVLGSAVCDGQGGLQAADGARRRSAGELARAA